MARTIALIPARSGSKGIPGKNFRPFADGLCCADRALLCARQAGIAAIDLFLCTDYDYPEEPPIAEIAFRMIHRPPELAQDDTPMVDVVRHALAHPYVSGDDDDIIVLLQPTQPFRTPNHIRAAVKLLRDEGADSVVSVVPVPKASHPLWQCDIRDGRLRPWPREYGDTFLVRATRRQDLPQTYRPDGTVYVTTRATVDWSQSLYGRDVRPLFVDPADSCELDTEADWDAAVRRWQERHAR